ncbi:hypothetical protein AN639_11745 [Candidatus Epulonipiscium fishelsonii]|uniref:Uncharacterized protein n=1 Tax=Candidatus Epulonipiscium fishelsonii TaxID=77094 RepID=A0ACC8XD84_9FIRM|nr:hypothetical protein AN396_05300 [Epulopiscium sp. SCG-B11WGA-EpuloA1]ONI42943.1 hypothetical protein AN639_11745 [Epulopiscium sp. SCG-B05WGA-EpuloA1]ONI48392.1 hypothetical protein AN643_01645 [Epulopiscium sp. SCG-B10WGA-EpuloB]
MAKLIENKNNTERAILTFLDRKGEKIDFIINKPCQEVKDRTADEIKEKMQEIIDSNVILTEKGTELTNIKGLKYETRTITDVDLEIKNTRSTKTNT